MHICQNVQTFMFISVDLWQKLKNAEFTGILLYREWILIIELKTSCGTIGLEASNCLQSFFEIQRETTESERYGQQLFTMWKQQIFFSGVILYVKRYKFATCSNFVITATNIYLLQTLWSWKLPLHKFAIFTNLCRILKNCWIETVKHRSKP